jgi:translocation and assembly module TamB
VRGTVAGELHGDGDPRAGTLVLKGAVSAPPAKVDLDLDARFNRQNERLAYRASLGADRLDFLLASVSESASRAVRGLSAGARLQIDGQGDFAGILQQGTSSLPAPTEDPIGSARGSQALTVELSGLDYQHASGSVRLPKLSLELESEHGAGGKGRATARLAVPSLDVESARATVRVGGLDQELVATFDRAPNEGMLDLRSTLVLASGSQSLLPSYSLAGLRVTSEMQIDRLRSIFVRDLRLDSPASGTSLRASGAYEKSAAAGGRANAIAEREALALEGRLKQELAPLTKAGLMARASGTLEVPFRLESGDLLGYRLLASLEANQVSFENADRSLVIDELRGVVPLVEDFVLLESGPVLSAGPRSSPLSETRFFDVHPFLGSSGYVTAQSIQVRGETFGPLGANVRVDRTDFSIDQLQTGYRGGQIVGQVRVAYRDGDPVLRLRLNATGLRTRRRDDGVLDANMALSFVPAALTLDGKVQVVRASRNHLRDMLDVLDPFHEMVNANRVRQALFLGYPKFVRFQLHDGAVDAKVELGGLAKLVRIDEIKAVPLGPILQKYVAPQLTALPLGRRSAPDPAAQAEPRAALEERQESDDVAR